VEFGKFLLQLVAGNAHGPGPLVGL
mgnify:CR=1